MIVTVKQHIDLKSHFRAALRNPYRTGLNTNKHKGQQTDLMIDENMIKATMSERASLVVFSTDKDGKLRFCIDYRKFNAMVVQNSHPFLRIDECFDSLGDATIFSTADCNNGYGQIEVPDADRDTTIFSSHHGFFRFIRMPFGLQKAPASS